jgi:hypothetical protein
MASHDIKPRTLKRTGRVEKRKKKGMVRPEGVEPPTYWFVASCSIQLSYGRTLQGMQLVKDNGIYCLEQTTSVVIQRGFRKGYGAPGEIRTPDPLVRSRGLFCTLNDIQCYQVFPFSTDYQGLRHRVELVDP